MPHHVEKLYALIRENEGKTEMCYRLAPTIAEVYVAVTEEEVLGTGWTPETLRLAGWVARPVSVEEE
jgi:hypothetical protein